MNSCANGVFDWIVVGGGPTGSALVRELHTKNPQDTILFIDKGKDYDTEEKQTSNAFVAGETCTNPELTNHKMSAYETGNKKRNDELREYQKKKYNSRYFISRVASKIIPARFASASGIDVMLTGTIPPPIDDHVTDKHYGRQYNIIHSRVIGGNEAIGYAVKNPPTTHDTAMFPRVLPHERLAAAFNATSKAPDTVKVDILDRHITEAVIQSAMNRVDHRWSRRGDEFDDIREKKVSRSGQARVRSGTQIPFCVPKSNPVHYNSLYTDLSEVFGVFHSPIAVDPASAKRRSAYADLVQPLLLDSSDFLSTGYDDLLASHQQDDTFATKVKVLRDAHVFKIQFNTDALHDRMFRLINFTSGHSTSAENACDSPSHQSRVIDEVRDTFGIRSIKGGSLTRYIADNVSMGTPKSINKPCTCHGMQADDANATGTNVSRLYYRGELHDDLKHEAYADPNSPLATIAKGSVMTQYAQTMPPKLRAESVVVIINTKTSKDLFQFDKDTARFHGIFSGDYVKLYRNGAVTKTDTTHTQALSSGSSGRKGKRKVSSGRGETRPRGISAPEIELDPNRAAQFLDPSASAENHHFVQFIARKGVVTSCGAYQTPRLLARSGIMNSKDAELLSDVKMLCTPDQMPIILNEHVGHHLKNQPSITLRAAFNTAIPGRPYLPFMQAYYPSPDALHAIKERNKAMDYHPPLGSDDEAKLQWQRTIASAVAAHRPRYRIDFWSGTNSEEMEHALGHKQEPGLITSKKWFKSMLSILSTDEIDPDCMLLAKAVLTSPQCEGLVTANGIVQFNYFADSGTAGDHRANNDMRAMIDATIRAKNILETLKENLDNSLDNSFRIAMIMGQPWETSNLKTPRDHVATALEHIQPGMTSTSTCRMSMHPYDGVVSPSFRVWGVSNLYACDASVLPDIPVAPPVGLLTALGHCAADIITEIFQKTAPLCQ